MNAIRNFIYLDYEKMYSLSAQLFQGVIFESIAEKGYVFSEKNTLNDNAHQNPENTSVDNSSRVNYIKPYDYHYSMFEEKLSSLEKISHVSKSDLSLFSSHEEIEKSPFIKSTGEIIINDPLDLYNLTKNFKKISGHLNYISHAEVLNDIYVEMAKLDPSEKSAIAKLRAESKKIEEKIKYDSDCINETYNSHLAEVIKFSFGDNDIEVNQNLQTHIITAYMHRRFFKQDISSLVKKYSRKTVLNFTILGIATQYKKEQWEIPNIEFPMFRDAMKNLVVAQNDVEKTFSEPCHEEIVVEPIAMYTEI